MGQQHHHRVATSTMLTGLLILLISLGGSWGEAYGQTAGPTPTVGQRAVLSVTKQVDNATPRRGDIVSFTIRVQNTGSVAALNVVIRDVVPGTFDVLRASATSGAAEVRGQVVTITVPQIDPGVTVLATIEARVRNDARGQLRNTVVVRAAGVVDGSNAAEVSATVLLDVAEQPDATPPTGASPPAGGNTGGGTGDNTGGGAGGNTGGGAGGNTGGGAGGNIGGGAGGDTRRGSNPLLSGTGAGSGLQLPLLVIGIMLVLIGGLIFTRVRNTQ